MKTCFLISLEKSHFFSKLCIIFLFSPAEKFTNLFDLGEKSCLSFSNSQMFTKKKSGKRENIKFSAKRSEKDQSEKFVLPLKRYYERRKLKKSSSSNKNYITPVFDGEKNGN